MGELEIGATSMFTLSIKRMELSESWIIAPIWNEH